MVTIQNVRARAILDSRGTPTIETTLTLNDAKQVVASVPSGASVGTFEAHELRDNDPSHFDGKGVEKAVSNINTVIAPEVAGKDPTEQPEIDKLLLDLDGTNNKSNLGANAILSVSIAVAKAGAYALNTPLYAHITQLSGNSETKLPHILSNLINGGLHAGKNLDIQEFLVIPKRSGIKSALELLTHLNTVLKKEIVSQKFQPLIGDEGGFAPMLSKNEDALSLLSTVSKHAGFEPGSDLDFGMDAAASSFYENDRYRIKDKSESLSGSDLGEYYRELAKTYSLSYLEDPFAEDDIDSWREFAEDTPDSLITTGDDLTVTNPARLTSALDSNLIRGIIIKPNQIGSLTETLEVVKKAKEAGLTIIVSHRSGETNDDFIADIAVGVSADLAKFGAPVRGERVAKYNRLLQIEEELTH